MHSLRQLLRSSRPRHLSLVIALAAGLLPVGAAAAAPTAGASSPQQTAMPLCSSANDGGSCSSTGSDGLQVSLPAGAEQCPASGAGASCVSSDNADAATPGTPSTPSGQTACSNDPGSALATPAACSDTVLGAVATSSNDTTPPASNPTVAPSVPITTLQPVAAVQRLALTSSGTATQSGDNILLTATVASTITGSGNAIEIFDVTTGRLIGACTQGGQCSVSYSAAAGIHKFEAFLAQPSTRIPAVSLLRSNTVSVGWINLSLTSTSVAVGPGKTATLTASTTIPVEQFGYAIEMFDLGHMNRITFCSRGTNCSISLSQSVSGSRSIVAAVGRPTATFSNPDIWAVSDHLTVTWLSASIAGTSTFQVGGQIHLTASTNADLTGTPWSLGIVDGKGHLVGPPCKTGLTCTATVAVSGSQTPRFSAVIGAVPSASWNQSRVGQVLQKATAPADLVDIQAQSGPVQPQRILWGVDSCKAFTGDPTGEVIPGVQESLGNPDFWGRYLTSTICPGISWSEIYTAARMRMAILPIYNDYDCSAVSGYDTGMGYARIATAVAAHDTEPKGDVIAIDIEPPGAACPGAANVDSSFIRGWYDGVTAAGYVPVFYGNGTAGSEFGAAWCDAQSQDSHISWNSYIWSFEPSLDSSGWSRANAPVWQPQETGCPDYVAAWQYQLGSNSPDPDVDADEVLSTMPLWWPTNTP